MTKITQDQLNSFATTLNDANQEEGIVGVAYFLRQYATSLNGGIRTTSQYLNPNEFNDIIEGVERANEAGVDALIAFLNSTARRLINADEADRQAMEAALEGDNPPPPPFPRGRLDEVIELDPAGRGSLKSILG